MWAAGRVLPASCSFRGPQVPGRSLACRSVIPISTSNLTWPSSAVCLFLRGHLFEMGLTPLQEDLILTRFHQQRPYLQIRPHSQGPGVSTSTYLLGNESTRLCLSEGRRARLAHHPQRDWTCRPGTTPGVRRGRPAGMGAGPAPAVRRGLCLSLGTVPMRLCPLDAVLRRGSALRTTRG